MNSANFKHKIYLIEDFIQLVKQKIERSEKYDPTFFYAIYAKEDYLFLGQKILVSNTVSVSDDDSEIYPEDVIALRFSYSCSDENIQDVIDLAIQQKPHATNEEIIHALNYYLEKDNFLDLNV